MNAMMIGIRPDEKPFPTLHLCATEIDGDDGEEFKAVVTLKVTNKATPINGTPCLDLAVIEIEPPKGITLKDVEPTEGKKSVADALSEELGEMDKADKMGKYSKAEESEDSED